MTPLGGSCWGRNYMTSVQFSLVQFSSVQFKVVYLYARKSPYALHPVSQKFPNVALETVPMLVGLMMVLTTHLFKEDCLLLPIFMPLSSR